MKRKDNLAVSVYPVPANDIINVRIGGSATGTYYLSLSNTLGQKLQQTITVLSNAGKTISLSASQLTGGIYYLTVIDQKGNNVYNSPVVIQR